MPEDCHWLQGLSEPVLMRDVDRYVDVLYHPSLLQLGIPNVKTEWHRYAADLNRVPDDIDASSVKGSANEAGLHRRGFHWVITTLNEQLMREPMSKEMHEKLVKLIYEPFHASLRQQYENLHKEGFKEIYHLDAHSMPSVGTKEHRDPGETRADIVVSDSHGKSSRPEFVDLIIAAYAKAGFKVAYNWPYYGGRVTEQYGSPQRGQHVVQVELNRSLYMDEATKKLKPEHQKVQEKILKALQMITQSSLIQGK
ncbi:MAG: hydrolase [Oligoflexia bacterium]|nr:MAG: hydrolase [Oligoflexia bacterium]